MGTFSSLSDAMIFMFHERGTKPQKGPYVETVVLGVRSQKSWEKSNIQNIWENKSKNILLHSWHASYELEKVTENLQEL